MQEAISAGWTMDRNCSQMNGNRFIKNGDRAVMLLFGAQGQIAGISAGIPKNLPYGFPSGVITPYFQDEGDFLSITAYFIDPKTVCSSKVPKIVTGDRLVIQSSSGNLNVPLTETEINTNSFWTKGQCFYTMGLHYWADARGVKMGADTTSDEFLPIFLLYNKGNLNGFGWAFNADLPSIRYEHPTVDVLPKFLPEPYPSFFNDPTKHGILSTLHIYFDSTPLFNLC